MGHPSRRTRLSLPALGVLVAIFSALAIWGPWVPEVPSEHVTVATPPAAARSRPSFDPRAGLPQPRPRDRRRAPAELQRRAPGEIERERQEASRRREEALAKAKGEIAPPEPYTPREAAERFTSPYNDGNPFKFDYR